MQEIFPIVHLANKRPHMAVLKHVNQDYIYIHMNELFQCYSCVMSVKYVILVTINPAKGSYIQVPLL